MSKEWALAAGVVAGAVVIGYALGEKAGRPWVGVVAGAVSGLAINWFRECPVCRAQRLA